MKKIIVPTDFSDTAKNAADYALDLARNMKVEIQLLHAFYPAMQLNTGYMIDPSIEDERKSQLDELRQSYEDKAQENDGETVSVDAKFVVGFPIEEIVSASQEEDTVIVMGATGDSGVMGRLFGSVSSNVAKQAHCPVFLIPREAKFHHFTQMMCASDEPIMRKEVEDIIVPMVKRFDAQLHAVHVGRDGDRVQDRREQIEHPSGAINVVNVFLDRVDIVSALNEYAEQHHIDLLILSAHHRSFWNRLVHVSITHEMALQPKVPLLILHDKDRNPI